jgi:phage terminase large subunit
MAKMVSYAKTVEKQKKLNFDSDVAKFTDRQMEAVRRLDSGTVKFLLYGGALGGGKSYFLRWILVRLLMTWFQTKGLRRVQVMLACEDYPSLKDRQLSKIGSEFPLWLGKSSSDHKDYGRCFILNDEYGGGVLCFRNLDDSSKYQSAEFAAIAVDELTKNDVDT